MGKPPSAPRRRSSPRSSRCCARWGLRLSARTWTALTVLKLLPLVALAVVFLVSPRPPAAARRRRYPRAASIRRWGAAALIATFAFQGFEIVPVLAGQAQRPAFSVPLATVGSLVIAAVLYVVLQAACVSALPNLAASRAPLVEAAAVHGGPGLAAVRRRGDQPLRARDRVRDDGRDPVLPGGAGPRRRPGAWGSPPWIPRGVPSRALFVTWALVTLLIQAGGRGELFALSSIAVLSQYLVTAAALLALALRRRARAGAAARRARRAGGHRRPRPRRRRVPARGDRRRGRARGRPRHPRRAAAARGYARRRDRGAVRGSSASRRSRARAALSA